MRTVITKYQVKNTNLKKRIVMISDLHYYIKYKRERFTILLEQIKTLKPDYICIPGDLLDSADVSVKADMTPFYTFMKSLTTYAPVIVTLGNHDIEELGFTKKSLRKKWVKANYSEWIEKLKKIKNIYFLDQEGLTLDSIYFFGYNPSFEYYKSKKKPEQLSLFLEDSKKIPVFKNNKYSILLLHTPLVMEDPYYQNSPIHQFSLVLSGHTHNGLMPEWYRGNRGIITPSKGFFPKKVRGMWKIEDTTVIVSSGIIKLSHSSKYFHYFNDLFAMGITVVDLT